MTRRPAAVTWAGGNGTVADQARLGQFMASLLPAGDGDATAWDIFRPGGADEVRLPADQGRADTYDSAKAQAETALRHLAAGRKPHQISYARAADGTRVSYHDYPLRDVRYLLPDRRDRVASNQRDIAAFTGLACGITAILLPAGGVLDLLLSVLTVILGGTAVADFLWARHGGRFLSRRFTRAVTTAAISRDPAWEIREGNDLWVDAAEFTRARRWHATTTVYTSPDISTAAGRVPARLLRLTTDRLATVQHRRLIIVVSLTARVRRAAVSLSLAGRRLTAYRGSR
jgi:hypothetical protein